MSQEKRMPKKEYTEQEMIKHLYDEIEELKKQISTLQQEFEEYQKQQSCTSAVDDYDTFVIGASHGW